MKNKAGVVTSTYPKNSLLEALAGISKAGFKYVELVSIPGFNLNHIMPKPEEINKKDVFKILNLCKRYGLEIYCVAGHTRLMKENSVNNFKKVIDVTVLFGANFVTTDTGKVETEDDEKIFYRDINEIADYAKQKDVTVCLEMHGDWCNTGRKGAEIVKTINHSNIKLNYDTGNVVYYGDIRPEEDIKYAIPYISFIHLKDKRGGYKVWDLPALGDGEIDFNKIFKLLKSYDGPMSVEVEFDGKEHSLQEINEAVKKSYDFLKSYGIVN